MPSVKQIEITTPDNVTLHLELASVNERAGAFFIDFLLLVISTVLFVAFLYFSGIFYFSPLLTTTIIILTIFLLWNGYFIFFELRSGHSPGKKIHRFKVIQEDGTALSIGAIYVRNLLREIEIWIPLRLLIVVLLTPSWSGAWTFASFSWMLVAVLFPFFDKKNRRLGDIVAGTVVVIMPEFLLEKELAEEKTIVIKQDQEEETISFTPEMLDIYGKNELQALEEILRRYKNMPQKEQVQLISKVVKKIQKKIGYKTTILKKEEILFLEKFYQEQRKYLEQKLIHGKSLVRKR